MDEQHITRRVKCALKYGDRHDFEKEHTLFINPRSPPPTLNWRSICKMCGAYQIHEMNTIIHEINTTHAQIHVGPEGRMFEYWKKNKN